MSARLKPHAKHSMAYTDDIDELLASTTTLRAHEGRRVEYGNTNIAIRKALFIMLQQLDWDKRFNKRRRYCLAAGHPRVANEDNLGQLNNPTVLTLFDIVFELAAKAGVKIE